MSDVMERTISVTEAAERLRMSTAEAYDLVFTQRLRTIESPTGRRVVPIEALHEYLEGEDASDGVA